MLREICIFICIFGIAFGASVATPGGKKNVKDSEEDAGAAEENQNPVPEDLPTAVPVSLPPGVKEFVTGLSMLPGPPPAPPVPAPPVPLAPASPVAIQFPPLDVIRNMSASPPAELPSSGRPLVLALPQQSVYMERYYWPMSAMVRSPAVAPANNNGLPKMRSHTPYHIDSAAQPYLPTTHAMVYASVPYQQSLLSAGPGATAGYPPYYYVFPYNQPGDYYYDYYYEESDRRERQ